MQLKYFKLIVCAEVRLLGVGSIKLHLWEDIQFDFFLHKTKKVERWKLEAIMNNYRERHYSRELLERLSQGVWTQYFTSFKELK